MIIRITAPDGKKIRDTRTDNLFTEVYCDSSKARFFIVADGDQDPITHQLIDGVTLDERVSDLEDAVIELAEIISEVE